MSELDFLSPLREEFEKGLVRNLVLRHLRRLDNAVLIEFSSAAPFPGVFRMEVPLPTEVGDATWNAFDDTTRDVREWTQWGIAVPVLEAYETQAQSAVPDDHGVITLHMP
ncbi:hypothetical protein ACFWZW_13955 [Microbacterium enclense]|uniref:hypothetical protein n=1 Tax=Microbacterium enclense TaxID=993073 RepID=UPI0036D871CA